MSWELNFTLFRPVDPGAGGDLHANAWGTVCKSGTGGYTKRRDSELIRFVRNLSACITTDYRYERVPKKVWVGTGQYFKWIEEKTYWNQSWLLLAGKTSIAELYAKRYCWIVYKGNCLQARVSFEWRLLGVKVAIWSFRGMGLLVRGSSPDSLSQSRSKHGIRVWTWCRYLFIYFRSRSDQYIILIRHYIVFSPLSFLLIEEIDCWLW
jgi:hypothetical protein